MVTEGALHGQRVVVTGGTSGIGRAVVLAAGEAGADVAFCGHSAEGADDLIRHLSERGRQVLFQTFDIADEPALRDFALQAQQALGGIDALINNAGTNFFRGVLEATRADIARCFEVDFYPAWALSNALFPALKVSGGIVVNVASVHARRTQPGSFPYNAAKAALVALTQAQALDWGPHGVRAVAIAPGLIDTPLAERWFETQSDPAQARAEAAERQPLRRLGRSEDVAHLIVSLLSRAGGFLTGTTLTIDGGVGARLE
ncbi:SDR family NAD(P)-dependent oxidoreductase [Deinococcus sp.]|uniref:SDR family NAD(P)-dependent oxidoreductase n=1 Tax=Deinococcus sp. TaxID=47478 RepID=UPI003CC5F5DD